MLDSWRNAVAIDVTTAGADCDVHVSFNQTKIIVLVEAIMPIRGWRR